MRKLHLSIWFSAAMLTLVLVGSAFALPGYLTTFNNRYGTSATALNTCVLCHPAGGGNNATNLNSFAQNFISNGHLFTAALENLDSDGDGFTNIAEINARSFPGNAASVPATGGDTTAPAVTAFAIPATAASLTVTITTFTATDNVAVTGYLLTESATAPLASAAGWTAAPPANYLFAAAGSKVLFAWAKDAAGNVSTSLSAPVTIAATATAAPLPAAEGADGGSSGCFIATAAFGSSLDPHVSILRDFRDTFLLTNGVGRKFVNFYYRVSPDIAQRIGASELLRMFVRVTLLPAIGFSYLALNLGMAVSLALILAFLLIPVTMVLRVSRRS